MKLKDILNLINSSHRINVQYEDSQVIGGEIFYSTMLTRIDTTMYGNSVRPIDPELLEREVFCIFPVRNELYVYLKTQEE